MEAATECILTKPRAKCKVWYESLAVREKWKKVSLHNKINPTNVNGQKFLKA